jgi:hypothetical protein
VVSHINSSTNSTIFGEYSCWLSWYEEERCREKYKSPFSFDLCEIKEKVQFLMTFQFQETKLYLLSVLGVCVNCIHPLVFTFSYASMSDSLFLIAKRDKIRIGAMVCPFMRYKNASLGWVLVAHTCNPSYLGGRDQDDYGLRPAQMNSS